MMLAEASNEFMGAWVYALLALLGGGAAAFGIYFGFRKPPKTEVEQPIETRRAPKRYNHDLSEQRFADHERRLSSHDEEIEKLWGAQKESEANLREEVKANREHNEELMAAQTDEIHHMENRLRDKIDGLGSRLIADFKNMMRDK